MDPAVEGRTYPPVAFALDPERVAAFAAAVGHPGDDVPPTIVTVPELEAGLRNIVADRDLGLDLSRILHGEQEYEWGRPLVVGESIVAQATIEDVRARGELELLRLRTDIRDEAGRTVAIGRTTLVVRRAG